MIPRTTVDIGNLEKEAVNRVLQSGQFVKGKECPLLEKEFSQQQNVKFGAGVNSGTSALHLSLLALNVKLGDEVVTTPNTFAATINAIILTGAKPIFVDINPKTFTLDITKLENVITEKTKVILPVHLYGLITDMKQVDEIAKKHDLRVLEDACQAHGAEYFGRKSGSFDDLAAFSFFPTKNATVAGDGGIVLSNNEELIEKIKSLRDHGRRRGEHVIAGLNNRLSEILAAIGREHIKKLDQFNNHRRKIANIYNQELDNLNQIELPIEPEGSKHVYHLFTIKAEERNKLQQFLKENKVGSKIMYPEKLNHLEYVKEISGFQQMPVNDKINAKILSLPISGSLDLEKIDEVVNVINKFYSE